MRQQHKPTTLPLGTISSGTLRLEDLIPALASALADLRLTRTERKIVNEALAYDFEQEPTDGDLDRTEQDDLYDELTRIAEAHCPDYTYFGSLEGDGAEIGVWPSVGEFDMGLPTKVYDTADLADIPSNQSHALHVNDHGNTTLYRRAGRRWIEVWAVV